MARQERARLPELLTRRRRRLLGQLVAIGFAQAAVAIAIAHFVGHTFDLFANNGGTPQFSRLPIMAAALGALVLADGWLRMLERVRAERLGQDYVLQVRSTLFRHLTRVAPRRLRRQSRGGMLLRFVGDLTPLRQWMSLGVARIAVAGVVVPLGLVALAFQDWRFSAMVLAVLVAGGLATLGLGNRLQRATREARRKRSHMVTNVSEKLSAMATVQAHGQERNEVRHLRRQGKRLFAAMVDRARAIGWVSALVQCSTGLASVGVLLLGVYQVTRGSVSPGVVVSAMTLVGIIVRPLHDLMPVYEYYQGAHISREKIETFLALPPMRHERATLRRRKGRRGHLRFKQVTVAGALEGFDAVAEGGRLTAITGPNGSGKSTLLALAAGLLQPDSGRVLLDGRDLARIRPRYVRRAIGMAGPDLPLLRGTLRKNLCYRNRFATAEELTRVCALCGVDEVIASLPKGLDTRLREGGQGLSFGQRQRVALARALLGTPDVLLLDEIDANLDGTSRAALDRVLSDYPGTILLATHDPKLAAGADAVWQLDGGRLVDAAAAVPDLQLKVPR